MGQVVTDDFSFTNEGHKRAYAYWKEKKGARRAPSRKDIDPLEIRDLLPNIFMMDVLHDPLDYKMRLVGTKLVDAMGVNPTGEMFHDIYKGEIGERLWDEYEQVVTNFDILYSEHTAAWVGKEYAHYERMLFPLSDDGEDVSILLGVTFFFNEPQGT